MFERGSTNKRRLITVFYMKVTIKERSKNQMKYLKIRDASTIILKANTVLK